MIRYKCSECKKEIELECESKTYSIKDLLNEKDLTCSFCGGKLNKNCDGISFKVPVYDLSYAKSYKRFKNGLHYDTTVKDKEKTRELNEEMRYNNNQEIEKQNKD